MTETKTVSGIIVGKEENVNRNGEPYFKLKLKDKATDQYSRVVNANPTTPGFSGVKLNQKYEIQVRESPITLKDGKQSTSKWALNIQEAQPEEVGEQEEQPVEERLNEPTVSQKSDVKELYGKALFDVIGIVKDHAPALKELQEAGLIDKIDPQAMAFSLFKAKRDSR